ncbi:MAG: heavy metal-associated domain-containing protein [Bacillota bacterium]|nr:heavy metal-associated domain-containing protein [Bacillota bacterium]
MDTVHYNVSGMAGSESKTKIKNALDEIKGVQEVAVDIARGTVEVQYNPPADWRNIKQCIEKTGYIIK